MYEVHSLNDVFITFISEKDIGKFGSAAGSVFTANDGRFVSNNVAHGDILTINGIGQFRVNSVSSQNQLSVIGTIPTGSGYQYSVGEQIDLSADSCQKQYLFFVRNLNVNPQPQFDRVPQFRNLRRRRRLIDFFVTVDMTGLVYDLDLFNRIADLDSSYTIKINYDLEKSNSNIFILGCENVGHNLQNVDNQDSQQQLSYQGIYYSYIK